MFTKKLVKVFLLIAALGLFNTAHAKLPLFFGEEDYLENIEGVEPIVDGNQTYHLGYRVTIKWFIAGIYAKDDGYILTTSDDRYIPLTPTMIAELQDENLLPKELPKYSLAADYYLKGYSLWIVLVAVAIFLVIKQRRKKPEVEEVVVSESVDKEN